MTGHKRFSFKHPHAFHRLALAFAVILFLGLLARFYIPGKGFSALIMFGENNAAVFIPELQAMEYHADARSYGYDAQWYVQLAIRPDLKDPALPTAIDNLPYRARRILFSWTAWVAGLGQPRWIMNAYALQNAVCWLGLGWLLLRWFKPTDWGNVVRWLAVMFSFGLIVSVRESLVDGPSLLLVAVGVALLESRRPWLAALAIGVAGLGKETSLLSASALAKPEKATVRAWAVMIAQGLLAAVPLALWMAWLLYSFGKDGADSGSRAFAAPFVAFWDKGVETVAELLSSPANPAFAQSSLWMLISLATQFLVLVLRPRWNDAWWRVGAAYAVLMIFLGPAVWEGYPGAASRVLLPMTLAFNVVIPKGRSWWPVLLLGNLTLINTPDLIKPPGGEGYDLKGPSSLVESAVSGRMVKAKFDAKWFAAEQTMWDYWRWSEGTASVHVTNPHAFPVKVAVSFELTSLTPRRVALVVDGVEQWSDAVGLERKKTRVTDVVLKPAPAVTELTFLTLEPGTNSGNPADPRMLAFRMYEFQLEMMSAVKAGP